MSQQEKSTGDERSGSLKLTSLKKSFGAVEAVKGFDLDLSPGEFVTILGPSGSGKTTTLAMIAGFEFADEGRILLDQRDITLTPPHKRGIGVVFQNYMLFPHMSVAQNVSFPLRMRRMKPAEIDRRVGEALALVRLSGLEERYPRELSGGQQQRVALARAAVYEPPLLLMDEPLSALDRNLREEMRGEIRRLHHDLGTSFLYVTHDQEEALSMSDRVLVMRDGLVEQVGTPRELYERPKTLFVARFLGDSNLLRGVVQSLGPDGTAVVQIRDGSFVEGTPTTDVVPKEEVLLLIRPEDLHPCEAPAASAVSQPAGMRSSLRVDVRDQSYFGEHVICRGAFETGEELTIRSTPISASSLMDVGEKFVEWSTKRCIVMSARTDDDDALSNPGDMP